MTGRTVSNGRNDGNSADVDFDSILPGKITYTVKWRERGSLTHFYPESRRRSRGCNAEGRSGVCDDGVRRSRDLLQKMQKAVL